MSSSSSSSVPDYLRDDNVTQETRDLISSLPKEKGWLVKEIYQFQGIWYAKALLQGILNCQKLFQAKDSDIILATNPKSGVYYESPDFDFSELPSPRLMNTHISHHSLPESVKSSSCKIVYCCRNPKDMFVSLWHFGKKIAPEETADYPIEKAVEAFCKGKFLAGPFWHHVLEYWNASRENPSKVLFVTYEDLKKQAGVEIKRIAEFLGCGFIEEEEVREIVKLCSFETLSKLEVNREGKLPSGAETKTFFRKAEIGGWRDTLTESLAEEIDKTMEGKFQGSGLKFSC